MLCVQNGCSQARIPIFAGVGVGGFRRIFEAVRRKGAKAIFCKVYFVDFRNLIFSDPSFYPNSPLVPRKCSMASLKTTDRVQNMYY